MCLVRLILGVSEGGEGAGEGWGHYARLKLVFEAACWEDGCVCSKERKTERSVVLHKYQLMCKVLMKTRLGPAERNKGVRP